MTKIQLAAKAAWNGLMLITFGRILSRFAMMHSEFKSAGWPDILIFALICLILILVSGSLMNFRIPLRLTGTTAVIIESDSYVFFAKMQRLIYVFVGLILGCEYFGAVGMIAIFVAKLFPSIQSWISQCIEGDISAALESAFFGARCIFYLAGFLFCIYLLFGANRLVQWQITLLKQIAVKEPVHE